MKVDGAESARKQAGVTASLRHPPLITYLSRARLCHESQPEAPAQIPTTTPMRPCLTEHTQNFNIVGLLKNQPTLTKFISEAFFISLVI